MTTELSLCGVVIVGAVYVLIRNHYVFKYRKGVLNDSSYSMGDRLIRLGSLPSYDRMLWQVFTWNWDSYLAKAVPTPQTPSPAEVK